jgi:hypothetical protein
MSPGEAAEDKAVFSAFPERLAGRDALQWQLDLSGDE